MKTPTAPSLAAVIGTALVSGLCALVQPPCEPVTASPALCGPSSGILLAEKTDRSNLASVAVPDAHVAIA